MVPHARSLMFQSVFPSSTGAYSSPTPQATPLIAQDSFEQSSHGIEAVSGQAHSQSNFEDTSAESVRWERAWHTATSFLSEKLRQTKPSGSKKRTSLNESPNDLRAALDYLLSPNSIGWKLRRNNKADDLIWWYSQLLQEQFIRVQGPTLQRLCNRLGNDSTSSWLELRTRLISSKTILVGPFQDFVIPLVGPRGSACLNLLNASYSALVSQLLLDRLRQPLHKFLQRQAADSLGANADVDEDEPYEESMQGVQSLLQEKARVCLRETLRDLIQGGFPPESVERLLAKALDSLLKAHVNKTCSRRWDFPSSVTTGLQGWIAGPFSQLADECLSAVRRHSPDDKSYNAARISQSDVSAWQKSALRELGLLRMSELFEIVVDWDNGSRGGIEDLRQYTTSQKTRMHVVNHFVDTLSYRLLHPGASTDQILEVYIKIMRAFTVLDPRFVILDRVSRPIRRYLRDRDDTIRIIVAGLLSDPNETETSPDALGELAIELHSMDEMAGAEDDEEWGWDDMNWVPNPADADADYRNSSKGLDVIGNLLSLFEAKDTVVREFQNILGERLLSPESDFSREIRVLELLKNRFGEAALQGCEVMIKDIFDSNRTDALVKKEQNMDQGSESQLQFHSKILSRFFWPSLRDDDFRVPTEVKTLQDRYSHGFEEHKMQRKLAWLPSLGRVTVELQLQDRAVTESVTTWQASVIYAFNEADNGGAWGSPHKTAEQLVDQLQMDEELVNNALTFWVSKLVLYQPSPGIYQVLESLPTQDAVAVAAAATEGEFTSDSKQNHQQSQQQQDKIPHQDTQQQLQQHRQQKETADIVAAAQSASAAAAVASATSAVRSDEELAEEKMEVLWQYVVGMLTNQGAMPLQQMVMMLNFVVPGGFTHPQEEFRHFLQRKVDDGKLQMAGASYKMPKK